MDLKTHFSEAELDAFYNPAKGVIDPVGYHLRAPMPQAFLVTRDPLEGSTGVSVRTTTLTPLSWVPYTMAVSIPEDDEKIVVGLSLPQAECVLALPSRNQLRQLTLCAQRLPPGISEVQVARFKLCRSQVVTLPGIEDCPINFECRVEHVQPYHQHVVAFLRVVGASIDAAMLFKERLEIVSIYPTNLVDELVDKERIVHRRVSMLKDLFLCPTFPVSPKQGWYATFDIWMQDLLAEEYFHRTEYEKVVGWNHSWEESFSNLDLPERARLRENLTHVLRLMVRQKWDEFHTYMEKA